MTAGHDEYWTKTMRDAFEAARRAGVDLAFMGANTGYWQMRYEDERRTIVEYRSGKRDPETDPALKTVRFRDLTPPRPECWLEGVQWGEIGNADYTAVGAAITPTDPWFKGTRFKPTDTLPHLVGYEYDTLFDSCRLPVARDRPLPRDDPEPPQCGRDPVHGAVRARRSSRPARSASPSRSTT